MRTKIYLDTSIPSAYYDYSKPIRQLITQKWFENEASHYHIFASVLTIEEIDRMKDLSKKECIKSLLLTHSTDILNISNDIRRLADRYMDEGAIPKSEPEDALHIAIASMNNISGLASWNFKHIVSINPIRKIHAINTKQKLPILEIGSLELFGGSKYGNL